MTCRKCEHWILCPSADKFPAHTCIFFIRNLKIGENYEKKKHINA